MRHFKAGKSNELEATSIATSIPRRYCDPCHLSTPKSNPRCIHCRRLLTAVRVLGARIQTRVA
jgi:hypothetical protein